MVKHHRFPGQLSPPPRRVRGKPCGCGAAFGERVGLETGISREGAEARRGAKGTADFDMINMIYMIFDGSGGWV